MAKTDKQKRLKSSILALALAFAPVLADAAGLGKMTVVSALGQPLVAEIDLTSTREEYASLSAKIASPEAFKSQGIEYVSALSGMRFMLDKRPNGQAFLRVTSDRPLNEPFVDMLVELSWASGRLIREYTFLLDPPEVAARPAPVPVAAPEVKREAPPVAPVATPAAVAAPSATIEPRVEEAKPAAKAAARQPARTVDHAPSAPAKPTKPAAESAGREVKKGDTLGKIASEYKPEGISLDQMLVALFRSNAEAFDAGNMNRLRAGKILSIPDKEAATAVDPVEARKTVVAQAADFNVYRKKLATAVAAEPARDEAPKQAVAGKITPKVEDKAPAPPPGKDKLEVSRTEAGKDGKAGAKDQKRMAMIEEDLVARQKALEEANKRIVELEKNLNDLKKLAELKSAAGAKVQEQAQAAKSAPPAEAKKPEPPAAPPAPPPEAAKKAVAAAEAGKPAEAPVAAPPSPPAPAPKPAAPPPPPPPPPAPPPSFMEENPELVFGGGGVLALLLGYLGYGAWRRKKAQKDAVAGGVNESELAANSVFGTTAGQSIDTSAAVPTDFSQESIANAAADEGVDPVAEAEVYMAYGRDSQAEEILVEALKTNPTRHAIHLKLLEIYAARKSVGPFLAIAQELHGQTGGVGADWEKAASLGLSVDPQNPLYGGGTAPAAAAPVDFSASTVIMRAPVELETPAEVTAPAAAEEMAMDFSAPEAVAAPEPAVATEEVPASLDFDLDLGAPTPETESTVAEPAPAQAEAEAADGAMSLDFDLDLGAPAEPAPAPAAVAEEPAAAGAGDAMSMDFDLDLGAPSAPDVEEPAAPTAQTEATAADGNAMDFDIDLSLPSEAPSVEAPAAEAEPVAEVAPAAEAGNGVDFDFDLSLPAAEEAPAPPAAVVEEAAAVPSLDLGSISLDLELPQDAAPASEPSPAATEALDLDISLAEEPSEASLEALAEAAPPAVEDNPEVATKIELAQAYEEMGDKDGARELLQEVLNEGSPAQQEIARNKLAQLG